MHKTFLGAHTHRNHRLQIQHAKCVPHRPQSLLRFLCSCAEAGHLQMSGMDSLLAQRSMIRAK
jgi:hypothetical protein